MDSSTPDGIQHVPTAAEAEGAVVVPGLHIAGTEDAITQVFIEPESSMRRDQLARFLGKPLRETIGILMA